MSGFGINNLFGSNNNIQSNASKRNNKPFSIHSLSRSTNARLRCTFNAEKLKKIRDAKKNKIKAEYQRKYVICLNRIKKLNKSNITDMIYEIPIMMLNCSRYKPRDCLNYINERLLKQYMDTLILSDSDNRIFISWFHIEENIYEEEKRKREEEKRKREEEEKRKREEEEN
uniref:Uncharacterized protein n=1 Tax=Mimivirus LCMiAC02 TaxID=2506609 RepID=A0A481Z1N8_9VIRU|nr:MAG: uncharacterized protein LCMiAC02_01000 [Mimivirus LCMiAC02]